MKTLTKITTSLILTIGVALLSSVVAADNSSNRVYELRTYTATDGNLDKLLSRFRDHTSQIFLKHGMQIVGYWIPTDEEKSKNTLVYILSHASREQANESWKAFVADPEWKKVAKLSNADGPILATVARQYMTATDFSPMK